jgi:hypothetical protein
VVELLGRWDPTAFAAPPAPQGVLSAA